MTNPVNEMSEVNEVDGLVMCTFDEWYVNNSGWGPDRFGAEYNLAKSAWSAAIDHAAHIAYKSCNNYDVSPIVSMNVSDDVRYT